MTIKFHRLAAPAYVGGLPTDYDYINNAVVGTPAAADGASGRLPNSGTYFIGFQDPATSPVANRPHKALAENCDHLDNLLRRPIAAPARTNDATAGGGGVAGLTIVDSVYVGALATPTPEYINTLFSVVDDLDNDIFVAGPDVAVRVTAVLDGVGGSSVVGDNFSGSPYLVFTPAIPAGTVYRVYYGTHSTLAELSTDALVSVKIRGAQEVSGGVEKALALLHGNSLAWDAPWTSNVWTLASSGIDDRYRRSVSSGAGVAPESYFSATPLDAAGGGAWFVCDGPALTGYTVAGAAAKDPANAVFAVKVRDTTHGGATGFVYYGQRVAGTNVDDNASKYPGSASVHHLWPHDQGTNDGRTYVREWTDVSILTGPGVAAVQLTHSEIDFFLQAGETAISPGYDMLEVIYTDGGSTTRTMYVITQVTGAAVVQVRNLDGSLPSFGSAVTGVCRWISSTFLVGDGAGPYHEQTYSDGAPVKHDGLMYQVPVLLRSDGADDITRVPPSFAAAKIAAAGNGAQAMRWGGFSYASGSAGPVWAGALYGDGSIEATKVKARQVGLINNHGNLDTGVTTFDMTDGSTIYCSSVSLGATPTIKLVGVDEAETVTLIITSSNAYTLTFGDINGAAGVHYLASGASTGDVVRIMWVGRFVNGAMHWTQTKYADA